MEESNVSARGAGNTAEEMTCNTESQQTDELLTTPQTEGCDRLFVLLRVELNFNLKAAECLKWQKWGEDCSYESDERTERWVTVPAKWRMYIQNIQASVGRKDLNIVHMDNKTLI